MTPTRLGLQPPRGAVVHGVTRLCGWLVVALVVVGVVLALDEAGAGAHEPRSGDSDHSCAGDAQADEGGLLPDECWGRYPTSSYDIGFKDGNSWAVSRKIFGGLTELTFYAGRSLVQLALWLITWAYGWDVENVFGGVGSQLTVDLDRGIVGELQLHDKVWFVVVAWAAFTSLRGRLVNASGELLLSFLLAILGATLLGDIDGYRDGSLETLRDLSLAPLVLTSDSTTLDDLQDDDLTDQEIRDLLLDDALAQLHQGFVEQPHDVISWGRDLSDEGMEHCAELRDDILGHVGLDGHEDRDNGADERDYMDANGCERLHKFNEEPTGERLFSSVLYLAAAAVLLVLLALTALTVVLTKMFVVGLFALAPLVAPFAVLPGAGRRLAWSWLAALARSGLAVAGVGFVLSLMLLTVDALLGATNDLPIYARFFLIDMLVVAMISARKRVLAAGSNFTQQIADRAAAKPMGGTSVVSWMGGPGGFALGPTGNVGPPLRLRGPGADPAAVLASATGAQLRKQWGHHRQVVRDVRGRRRFARQMGQKPPPLLPKRVALRVRHPIGGWEAHRRGSEGPRSAAGRRNPRSRGDRGAWRPPRADERKQPERRTPPRPRPPRGPRDRGSASPLPDQSAPPPSSPPPRDWPPSGPSSGGAPA